MAPRSGNRRGGLVPVFFLAGLLLAGCSDTGATNAQSTTSTAPSASATVSSAATSTASPTVSASDTPSSSASSTVNALVPGFPTKVIPIMPGSTPLSTSYDATTNPAKASLVASTGSASAQILSYYSGQFTGQGFTAVAPTRVGTTDSQDFVRSNGKETVNVAVVVVDGRTTYTVGASVNPSALK
ncbi:hypothetical protein [Sinomonas susongensis]|uniref:hypothetical protein n=1 Tax=Sinomonas susongensis TaxID=1324851 RepID=UPI0011096DFA|nr:hypothetical protein [Sinomonas susongensis]